MASSVFPEEGKLLVMAVFNEGKPEPSFISIDEVIAVRPAKDGEWVNSSSKFSVETRQIMAVQNGRKPKTGGNTTFIFGAESQDGRICLPASLDSPNASVRRMLTAL